MRTGIRRHSQNNRARSIELHVIMLYVPTLVYYSRTLKHYTHRIVDRAPHNLNAACSTLVYVSGRPEHDHRQCRDPAYSYYDNDRLLELIMQYGYNWQIVDDAIRKHNSMIIDYKHTLTYKHAGN